MDLRRGGLLLLALTCGVAVGNVYFPQGITPLVAADFGVPTSTATNAVTATQLGYACGIFFLVPLGDRARPRVLVLSLLAFTAAALVLAGVAPTLSVLVVASWCTGVATVVAPVVGPLAAGLVAPTRQGAVGGVLLSGSIAGILLARVASGALGERLGWRTPYLIAAVLTAALAVTLYRRLPADRPSVTRSRLTDPLRLLWTTPALRRSCVYQACLFGAFSAVWTTVPVLLTGPSFGLTVRAVAVLGLVNAATMVCTPLAGRLVDRIGPTRVNTMCFTGTLAAAALLALASSGSMAALVAGMLVLDVTMQCGMVANQTRIYALTSSTRSRMNTAYMTCSYVAGAAGSWLGAVLCAHLGWSSVAALVAGLVVVALVHHRTASRRPAEKSLAGVR